MAWGKVDLCGLDTSKLPVLTPQRMQELYPLVHSGDKAARDEFIQGNLRLVLSVIQRFSGRGENVDDLFQVGCIGLMKALDNFDVSQNVRFSTYAVPMVIGEIRRYLRDNNAIRVSRSMRDTAYTALRARDREHLARLLHRNGQCSARRDDAAGLGFRPRGRIQLALERFGPVGLIGAACILAGICIGSIRPAARAGASGKK